jgi:hypothetical protein
MSDEDTVNTNTIFPLFDILYEKVNDKEKFTAKDTKELADNLQKIHRIKDNEMIYNILFIIIRIYSLRYSDDKVFDIPFQGEKLNSNGDKTIHDIKFDIRNFPPKLQHILLEYTKMEMKKHSLS